MSEEYSLKFSIVIPVYNRAASIASTLDSVVRQTYGNFECIVVDDGSLDGDELNCVIEALNDPRFVLLRQANSGGGAARNAGIKAAVGEWISLLDSDDAFFPEKLAILAKYIRSDSSVDVWAHQALVERGGDVKIVRPTRMPRAGESILDMMFRHREFMQTSTLTVRSDIAQKVLFHPTLRKAQDVDFMVRLERAGAALRCVPEVLSIWNDKPAENRVGAPRRPNDVLTWYSSQRQFFSRDIRSAFEATYLAYEIAPQQPVKAFFMISRAALSGSIGVKLALLCFLRAFLPPKAYRSVVDTLIRRVRDGTPPAN